MGSCLKRYALLYLRGFGVSALELACRGRNTRILTRLEAFCRLDDFDELFWGV